MRLAARAWPLLLAVGLVLPVLSGCQRDMSDLHEYIAKINARPGGDIEPIPTIDPHEPYLYPGHERSPFDSSVIERPLPPPPTGVPGEVDIDFDRPREPLESFPLDSLRMVGSLEQEGVRYALVRTPDRTIQTVRPGNHMGQNFGRVVEITTREILLIEVVPDAFGGYVERENTISLSE
ncbi:Type IV pilus biogenesis protein PilP [Thioalkalivibrio nitratireducens DSM 14787]|uniref:Type IV pilus biogenesis protein PilP n=1 Tax=Thioalkalivibrio nitratireducens (strain DSM 14787 / UNIQEM 213 / ALEN2) TaxID=1255043 RepID=L0E1M3_THIND|nr:pilus assembly protein PilP [Thioalkalivibrio nitratireducens]AGA35105.1 Type IV pilus biogenesis protein PilP [Thioalkalivibrio nitratireducens DSM 14787]